VYSFPLQKISEFIVSLSPEKIPPQVKELVSAQIASVMSASLAGYRSTLYQKILRGTTRIEGTEGILRSLELLSTASMIHDYDDYLFMGHTGHTAVWVPLILGHFLRSSAEEILIAMVLANEIGGRFGASLLFGPLNGQMWAPIHRIASASASARLLRLDAEKTFHALALSLYHPEFPSIHGFMGSDAKARTSAESAVFGVKSAFFSAEGMNGGKETLLAQRGVWKNFSYTPLRGTFSGLGESWVTLTLAVKPFPGCAYVDTPIMAFREVRKEFHRRFGEELLPHKISKIRLYVNALSAGMDSLSAPELGSASLPPVTVTFSTPLSLACELLFGEISPEVLEPENLNKHADLLFEIASHIEIIHDLSMTRRMVEEFQKVLPLPAVIKAFSFREWLTILRSGWERFRSDLQPAFPIQRKWKGSDLQWFLQTLLPHLLGLFLKPLQGFPPIPLDLKGVDFSSFRFFFPVRVELHLKDGTVLASESSLVPGGSGISTVLDLSREKWLREGKKVLNYDDVIKISDKIFQLDLLAPELKRFWESLLS
jgi:2-methylcitrate dehydratase PrpD